MDSELLFRKLTEVEKRTLNSEGDRLCQRYQFKKAIQKYKSVLIESEKNLSALCGRSRCLVAEGDTIGAVVDAENALAQNKALPMGLLRKAEAHYMHGDLENALVYFHRGNYVRPDKSIFKDGIKKCVTAISDCVGDPSKIIIDTNGLDFLHELRPLERPKGRRSKSTKFMKSQFGAFSLTNLLLEAVFKELRVPNTKGNDKIVTELMEELNADRLFLEDLVSKCDMRSVSGRNTYNIVCDSLEYMDKKRGFWQQAKPLYVRVWEMEERKKINGKSDNTSKKSFENKMRLMENELEKMAYDLSNGHLNECVERGEEILRSLKVFSVNKKVKLDLMATTHSFIGFAYFDMKHYKDALRHHEKDYEISMEINHPKNISRAIDNLGQVCARLGKYKKAIQIWSTKLTKSKTPLEATWLFHELGRCYMELNNWPKSLEMAKKSIGAALKAQDLMWSMNAVILLAESQICLGNSKEALDCFKLALDCGYRINNSKAVAVIRQAMRKMQDRLDRTSSHAMYTDSLQSFKPQNKLQVSKFEKKDIDRITTLNHADDHHIVKPMTMTRSKFHAEICFDIAFGLFAQVSEEWKRFVQVGDDSSEFILNLMTVIDESLSTYDQLENVHLKEQYVNDFSKAKAATFKQASNLNTDQQVDNNVNQENALQLFRFVDEFVKTVKHLNYNDNMAVECIIKKITHKIVMLALKDISSIYKIRNQDKLIKLASETIMKLPQTYGHLSRVKESNVEEYRYILLSMSKSIVDQIIKEVFDADRFKEAEVLMEYVWCITGQIVKEIDTGMLAIYDPLSYMLANQPAFGEVARRVIILMLNDDVTTKHKNNDRDDGLDDKKNKERMEMYQTLAKKKLVAVLSHVAKTLENENKKERLAVMKDISNRLGSFFISDIVDNFMKISMLAVKDDDNIIINMREKFSIAAKNFLRDILLQIKKDGTNKDVLLDVVFHFVESSFKRLQHIDKEGGGGGGNINVLSLSNNQQGSATQVTSIHSTGQLLQESPELVDAVKMITRSVLEKCLKLSEEQLASNDDNNNMPVGLREEEKNLAKAMKTLTNDVVNKVIKGYKTKESLDVKSLTNDVLLKILFECASKMARDTNASEETVEKFKSPLTVKLLKYVGNWKINTNKEFKQLSDNEKNNVKEKKSSLNKLNNDSTIRETKEIENKAATDVEKQLLPSSDVNENSGLVESKMSNKDSTKKSNSSKFNGENVKSNKNEEISIMVKHLSGRLLSAKNNELLTDNNYNDTNLLGKELLKFLITDSLQGTEESDEDLIEELADYILNSSIDKTKNDDTETQGAGLAICQQMVHHLFENYKSTSLFNDNVNPLNWKDDSKDATIYDEAVKYLRGIVVEEKEKYILQKSAVMDGRLSIISNVDDSSKQHVLEDIYMKELRKRSKESVGMKKSSRSEEKSNIVHDESKKTNVTTRDGELNTQKDGNEDDDNDDDEEEEEDNDEETVGETDEIDDGEILENSVFVEQDNNKNKDDSKRRHSSKIGAEKFGGKYDGERRRTDKIDSTNSILNDVILMNNKDDSPLKSEMKKISEEKKSSVTSSQASRRKQSIDGDKDRGTKSTHDDKKIDDVKQTKELETNDENDNTVNAKKKQSIKENKNDEDLSKNRKSSATASKRKIDDAQGNFSQEDKRLSRHSKRSINDTRMSRKSTQSVKKGIQVLDDDGDDNNNDGIINGGNDDDDTQNDTQSIAGDFFAHSEQNNSFSGSSGGGGHTQIKMSEQTLQNVENIVEDVDKNGGNDDDNDDVANDNKKITGLQNELMQNVLAINEESTTFTENDSIINIANRNNSSEFRDVVAKRQQNQYASKSKSKESPSVSMKSSISVKHDDSSKYNNKNTSKIDTQLSQKTINMLADQLQHSEPILMVKSRKTSETNLQQTPPSKYSSRNHKRDSLSTTTLGGGKEMKKSIAESLENEKNMNNIISTTSDSEMSNLIMQETNDFISEFQSKSSRKSLLKSKDKSKRNISSLNIENHPSNSNYDNDDITWIKENTIDNKSGRQEGVSGSINLLKTKSLMKIEENELSTIRDVSSLDDSTNTLENEADVKQGSNYSDTGKNRERKNRGRKSSTSTQQQQQQQQQRQSEKLFKTGGKLRADDDDDNDKIEEKIKITTPKNKIPMKNDDDTINRLNKNNEWANENDQTTTTTVYKTRNYGLARILDAPNEETPETSIYNTGINNVQDDVRNTPSVVDSILNRERTMSGGRIDSNSRIASRMEFSNIPNDDVTDRQGEEYDHDTPTTIYTTKKRKQHQQQQQGISSSVSSFSSSSSSLSSSSLKRFSKKENSYLTSELGDYDRLEMTLNSSLISSESKNALDQEKVKVLTALEQTQDLFYQDDDDNENDYSDSQQVVDDLSMNNNSNSRTKTINSNTSCTSISQILTRSSTNLIGSLTAADMDSTEKLTGISESNDLEIVSGEDTSAYVEDGLISGNEEIEEEGSSDDSISNSNSSSGSGSGSSTMNEILNENGNNSSDSHTLSTSITESDSLDESGIENSNDTEIN